ncbi:hypothetical protein MTP04_02440 [Lysinibacillus sp. PLM2]|nr:hypothetical protein MTP04_02440 [Lysinibacillus sp. PLM2]
MLCNRCNRKLKSQKSIDVGMGPTCKKKHEQELADIEFQKMQITIYEEMNGNEESNSMA